VIYAILSPTLGKYVDTTIASSGPHAALYNIAGVCISLRSLFFLAAQNVLTLLATLPGPLHCALCPHPHRDLDPSGCALAQPQALAQRRPQ